MVCTNSFQCFFFYECFPTLLQFTILFSDRTPWVSLIVYKCVKSCDTTYVNTVYVCHITVSQVVVNLLHAKAQSIVVYVQILHIAQVNKARFLLPPNCA